MKIIRILASIILLITQSSIKGLSFEGMAYDNYLYHGDEFMFRELAARYPKKRAEETYHEYVDTLILPSNPNKLIAASFCAEIILDLGEKTKPDEEFKQFLIKEDIKSKVLELDKAIEKCSKKEVKKALQGDSLTNLEKNPRFITQRFPMQHVFIKAEQYCGHDRKFINFLKQYKKP